jgi:hypothetical protein
MADEYFKVTCRINPKKSVGLPVLFRGRDGKVCSSSFGHEIFQDDEGVWRFRDTGEVEDDTRHLRHCPRCHLPPTEAGDDPCIANLPGVIHACCGHGRQRGYIMFEDGRIIRGVFTDVEQHREY